MHNHGIINSGRVLRLGAYIVCAAGFALLWNPCPAGAQEGGRPGGIFDFGAGARPLAMGGACTAMVTDASAVYYNPSGLGLLAGRNLSFMHASLFEGASYDYAGYAQNFGGVPGGWGTQVLRLSGGSGDGRDEFNNPSSGFSYAETAVSVGSGVRGVIFPLLSLGAGVKLVNRSLAYSSDRLFGFDVGLQYGPFLGRRVNLGALFQNLGSFSSGDTNDRLPFMVKFGASYAMLPGVLLAADVSDTGVLRIGTEYALGQGALRAGFDRDAVSLGGGLKIMKSYQLDFAVLKHSALGISNRISVGYKFGAPGRPARTEVFARDFIALAEKALRARRYVEAVADIDRAAGLDPAVNDGPWGQKRKRLENFVSGMGLRQNPAREAAFRAGDAQADEAALSLDLYLAGEELKSFLIAHSAAGINKAEAVYSDYLRLVARLTGNEIRKDEILPRGLMIKEKLDKAASAFYMRKFDYTVRQCEELVLMDDTLALAWVRLGSAYFAMGDKERARRAYLKALELQPNDRSTREFVKMQGWTN